MSVAVMLFGLIAGLPPVPARADDEVLKRIVNLFGWVSGYWFTGNAQHVLGSPKFGGDTTFYVRPAHRGNLLITGGVELVGASDHWLPFSGGNQFGLTGPSVRVGMARQVGRPSPFATLGVFYGTIHSDQLGVRGNAIVPSLAVGVAFRATRDITITARYRVSGTIRGVNTNGFTLGLSLF